MQSKQKVLLITPPFTQLNTTYPATVYIKGFLNTLSIPSFQCDLSLEVILGIFSKEGLKDIFHHIESDDLEMSDRAFRVFKQQRRYIQTIDAVMAFLQNSNSTLAHSIVRRDFLPEGDRFDQLTDETIERFGDMGSYDYAKHLCTLYIEDLGDLITDVIDEDFGFSRYAERIGRTASSFDDIYDALMTKDTIITRHLSSFVNKYVKDYKPTMVCITIPFPGNVFGAFKIAQVVKHYDPSIKILLGGGYINTELRRVYDPRVFEFVDFITLDDGEAPISNIIDHLDGRRSIKDLKRSFVCDDEQGIQYMDGSKDFDIAQGDTGTPDYSDLLLDKYISVLETVNPMHRLWSDGRWNKMTLAHGCYWGKCSFCDVTLDYIKRYEPLSASQLCDRIETIIAQTGHNGFHFVDEAAPPALMRDLAIEIIKRELLVVWWTNIRFEKTFSSDLCRLLRLSGCIAVTGGLEVASDRLLEKMQKGVTVAQVARVAKSFTEAGIMVHAYLMYGFPTQTDQETMDSMEMVRQMFEEGVIQSGFWHQFAMTAHSPVGLAPADYNVEMVGPDFKGFAENDYFHRDATGAEHDRYSHGLATSLYNYMNGSGFDVPLSDWFDFSVPSASIEPAFIRNEIWQEDFKKVSLNDKVLWIGGDAFDITSRKTKGQDQKMSAILFNNLGTDYQIFMPEHLALWWIEVLNLIAENDGVISYKSLVEHYIQTFKTDFEAFTSSSYFLILRRSGLLFV